MWKFLQGLGLRRDKAVVRGFARRDRGQGEARNRCRREIFQAMNGQIYSIIEQSPLNLFGEQTLAANLRKAAGPDIPLRCDQDLLDFNAEPCQLGCDPIGLPASQRTGASAKPNFGRSFRHESVIK